MKLNPDRDVKIDELRLDQDWLDQPELYRAYVAREKELAVQVDEAKGFLDKVRARVDAAIRKDPLRHNVEKVTEAVIRGAVLLSDAYQEAESAYHEARRKHGRAVADVAGMRYKKAALENLVKLHGQSYFAGPHVPHDIAEGRHERDRERNRRIAANLPPGGGPSLLPPDGKARRRRRD